MKHHGVNRWRSLVLHFLGALLLLQMPLHVTGVSGVRGLDYSTRTSHRKLAVGWDRPNQGKSKSKSKGDGLVDGTYDEEDDQDNVFNPSRGEITSEAAFISTCRSTLLSFGATWDGLISQVDAAEFIWDVCAAFDHSLLPDFSCPTPQFSNFPIEIQLSFVWYICPNESAVDLLSCLGDLGLEDEFGYVLNSDNFQSATQSVLGFCCSLLPYLQSTGITQMTSSVCSNTPVIDLTAPMITLEPTFSPVVPETPPPTQRPTPSPSVQQTPIPTTSIMNTPTLLPTEEGGQPVVSARGSDQQIRSVGNSNAISTGGVVGIALAGAAVLAAGVLLMKRRRRAEF